jgi:hypothetical protein
MASMDTMVSTLRLEMKLMFEEYLGKKSTRSTAPNTTSLVDLPIAKVKVPKGPSTSVEHSGVTLNGFHTSPPLDRYHNPPSYYPMPHINS